MFPDVFGYKRQFTLACRCGMNFYAATITEVFQTMPAARAAVISRWNTRLGESDGAAPSTTQKSFEVVGPTISLKDLAGCGICAHDATHHYCDTCDAMVKHDERVDDLTAERDRLREALREIAELKINGASNIALWAIEETDRTALGGG